MGLILNSTEVKKINLKGTDIELPSVYVRLNFSALMNGSTLQITPFVYLNKEAFTSGLETITTDVNDMTFLKDVLLSESQSVETAHTYAKLAFEQEGYEVVIDLA